MTVVPARDPGSRVDRSSRSGRAWDAVLRGAQALRLLGHPVEVRDGGTARLVDPLTGSEVAIEAPPPIGPGWAAPEYAGLIAAGRLLRGDASPVTSAEVAGGLAEGMIGGAAAELVRCADGWIVARFRDGGERELLDRRLGTSIERGSLAEVWQAAAECRLLVAPVLRPAAIVPAPQARLPGIPGAAGRTLRVVDWTSLWAGPWACGALAAAGDTVVRIEVPSRPDGLLLTAAGRAIWERFNAGKEHLRLDARETADRERIASLLTSADLLIDGNTTRVLPQLGFGEAWLRENAPRLSVLSLTAYDGQHVGLPGLGETASAAAGLLWRGAGRPATPLPWADPLAGAALLLVVEAWRRRGSPTGARFQVSLAAAAAGAAVPSHSSRCGRAL